MQYDTLDNIYISLNKAFKIKHDQREKLDETFKIHLISAFETDNGMIKLSIVVLELLADELLSFFNLLLLGLKSKHERGDCCFYFYLCFFSCA